MPAKGIEDNAQFRKVIKTERDEHGLFLRTVNKQIRRESDRAGVRFNPVVKSLGRRESSSDLKRQLFIERVARKRDRSVAANRLHFLKRLPTDLYFIYRTKGIRALIYAGAAEYRVSGSLLYEIAKCESHWKPREMNHSGSGAAGLFQFMPAWGPLSSRLDPVWSTKTAARAIAMGGLHHWTASRHCWG